MSGPTGLALACELAESGALMVAARHRRRHPDASDEEVADAVRRWWADRPGAPSGDAPGRARRLGA